MYRAARVRGQWARGVTLTLTPTLTLTLTLTRHAACVELLLKQRGIELLVRYADR